MSLAERLRRRIEAEGPMSFQEWMEACLYDPTDGYYMQRRRKTGTDLDADFATSPTLHPFMAHCIAQDILACWERLGRPEGFSVAEFGGGEGDLARDAQGWLREHGLELTWRHVEISPDHQEKQAGSGESVRALPADFIGVIVAHEFIDALPFRVVRRTDDGWEEQFVADGPLWKTVAPEADWPIVRPGTQITLMDRGKQWLTQMASMAAGEVLVVDYGREGPSHDSVRTFAKQQDGGSPLEDPGTKDITANVDFRQLRAWAEAAGFDAPESISQEAYLLEHGALDALNAISKDSLEGASSYLRLRQLLLPTAMGQAFRVGRFVKR